MIEVERADEIELNNGVTVMVKTSDYRAIRGLTVAACIADEIAFWDSGGISPDREVLVALPPAMSKIPTSKLLIISTPYSQSGTLYESHREHFGKDDDHVLVWVAETRVMNPTMSEDMIQRELELDPEAAKAEWLAGLVMIWKAHSRLKPFRRASFLAVISYQARQLFLTARLSIHQAAVTIHLPLPLATRKKTPRSST
jgi:hypothetical protein